MRSKSRPTAAAPRAVTPVLTDTPAPRAAAGRSPTTDATPATPALPAEAGERPVAARVPDSEKITINLGFVDLGQIDLLVGEGFYANRTDFIRTAIRNQIATHADSVRQLVARRTLVLGIQQFDAEALRAVVADGQSLQIRVLGLAVIADDVTPELARAAIASIDVLGALRASPAVRAALAGRIR